MATPEEIHRLKVDWVDDPCWDIFDTEGFEEHYDELKAFQEEKDRDWAHAAEEAKRKRIAALKERFHGDPWECLDRLELQLEDYRILIDQVKILAAQCRHSGILAVEDIVLGR